MDKTWSWHDLEAYKAMHAQFMGTDYGNSLQSNREQYIMLATVQQGQFDWPFPDNIPLGGVTNDYN